MRQAIIIKDAKWEPFHIVSEKFKKASEGSILVIRENVKEIKAAKPIAKIAKAAAVILFLALSITANAQQSLIANLPSTTANSFSTNWTAGSGLIGWNQDAVATAQLTVLGTNALSSGNVVVAFDTSDNATDWLTNRYEVTAPIWGTNNGTALVRITNSIGGKWLRVGALKNQATGTTNTATVVRFSISVKDQ